MRLEGNNIPMVTFQNVTKAYGPLVVLNELDLDVSIGEMVTIIGRSGSGKTTVLRMLMTLETINCGVIYVEGEPLTHMERGGRLVPANSAHIRRIRSKIGMDLLRTTEQPDQKFTLAFVAFRGGNKNGEAEIELTYNYGVSEYDHGTAYGHIALGVDNVAETCERIRAAGGSITRKPGPVKGGTPVIVFVEDPDGYKVELIETGTREL